MMSGKIFNKTKSTSNRSYIYNRKKDTQTSSNQILNIEYSMKFHNIINNKNYSVNTTTIKVWYT